MTKYNIPYFNSLYTSIAHVAVRRRYIRIELFETLGVWRNSSFHSRDKGLDRSALKLEPIPNLPRLDNYRCFKVYVNYKDLYYKMIITYPSKMQLTKRLSTSSGGIFNSWIQIEITQAFNRQKNVIYHRYKRDPYSRVRLNEFAEDLRSHVSQKVFDVLPDKLIAHYAGPVFRDDLLEFRDIVVLIRAAAIRRSKRWFEKGTALLTEKWLNSTAPSLRRVGAFPKTLDPLFEQL